MSSPPVLLFSVALRHLTADGRKASADLPGVQLYYIAPSQLQTLLRAVEAIAATVTSPVEPEVRINGPTGEFVVRVKDGQLNLVSWSSAHKSGPASAAEIIAAVTAEKPEASDDDTPRATKSPKRKGREKLALVLMGCAIVLVNCFTVWVLTRPPRSLAGNCRLLPPEPAERLLTGVVGAYETGKGAGDRRLEIRRDASAQRVKFGAGGIIKDQQVFTVTPADYEGKKALLTSRKSLITVKDELSLVMFGDTYTRVIK